MDPHVRDFKDPPSTVTEYVDVQRAKRCVQMKFEAFALLFEDVEHADLLVMYNAMVQYCIKMIRNKGSAQFDYKHSEGKNYGRLFGHGISTMPRDIRGFLCTNDEGGVVVTDVDMANAHPTILHWICVKNDIACETLEMYVKQRDVVFSKFKKQGVDRDTAKMILLKSMNSHIRLDPSKKKTKFHLAFDREMKTIQSAVYTLPEYQFMKVHAEKGAKRKHAEAEKRAKKEKKEYKGTPNYKGSFLNHILCLWENRMLGQACFIVEELGYEVAALQFDGFMVKGDVCLPLDVLSISMKNTFDIDMKWTVKAHSAQINIDKSQMNTLPPYDLYKYVWLDRLCRVGSEYVLKLETGDEVVESGRDICERTKSECHRCDMEDSRSSFGTRICSDPDLVEYEKFDIYPDRKTCPPTVYNRWKPFLCEDWTPDGNKSSENVEMFKKLVYHLSDCDPEVELFIYRFIAHMIKHPETKPGVWLCLMAEEGCGKGTLLEIIRAVLGKDKVLETNNGSRTMFGNHNDILENAFLVSMDEASGKSLFESSEEMKNLITGDSLVVNPKGKKMHSVRSFLRFIFTIQPRAVPTKRGDRRGVVVRCSDALITDHELFDAIRVGLKTEAFAKDIYSFLVDFEVPEVFKGKWVPTTSIKEALQKANSDVFETWVEHVCREWFSNISTLRDINEKHDPTNISPVFALKKMYGHFREYSILSGSGGQSDRVSFRSFTAKFEYCRWRLAFKSDKQIRMRRNGTDLLCKRWDMKLLVPDFDISTSTLDIYLSVQD